MNLLYGVPLEKIPVRDLRLTIMVMSQNDVSRWSRQTCIDWLNARKVCSVNVGNFCKILLRVVVRKNEEGFTVGLSYAKMLNVVKKHFPNSAVTERHFSWYATTMRAAGEIIPVYRE